MGFFIDLIILILVAAGFAFLNGLFIAGGLFLMHKYMGPSEESEAFDFNGDDRARLNRFIILTFVHGAVPSIAVVLVGYILHRVSNTLHAPGSGAWMLGFILLVFQLAGTFLAAKPLQKVEAKRALLLMAPAALSFVIYYPYAVADLLR